MYSTKRKIINFLLVMTMSLMSFQYAVAGYSMSASGEDSSQHMAMMKAHAQQMGAAHQPCHTVEQAAAAGGCDTAGHDCDNDCQTCGHGSVGLLSLSISPDRSETAFTPQSYSRFVNILTYADIRPPRQLSI